MHLDGLSSPKGLAVGAEGDVVIAQGAFGPPGPVLAFDWKTGIADPLTDPANITDVAISPVDGTGWALVGTDLFHRLADGTLVLVLDIAAYQAGDPDPFDLEGIPDESNPYGLTVLSNGDVLIADAAGNDIIRVTPDGTASTVARFETELVATDHLTGPPPPGEEPLPPVIPSEAVPTTVVEGPDGYIYVGELQGFPFRPGTSEIWRIAPDATDATCSPTESNADCEVYATGFTAIQDIAFNEHTGKLYVYELAAGGVLAFEAGFETGEFPPAVLLEVSKNHRRELAVGQLSQPGGIVVTRSGWVFVTDHVFQELEGRLLRVR